MRGHEAGGMAVATDWSTLTNTPHLFFRYPRSRGNASPASPPLAQIALPQGVVRPGQSLRHSSAQVTDVRPIRPREDARFRGLFPRGLSPARARESPSSFACKRQCRNRFRGERGPPVPAARPAWLVPGRALYCRRGMSARDTPAGLARQPGSRPVPRLRGFTSRWWLVSRVRVPAAIN